jgi:trimeric autotransporter adhesin
MQQDMANGAVSRYIRSNVLGLVAIFIALGGSAWAASSIGPRDIKKNAVRAKHVQKGAVKGKQLARGAVKAAKIANGAVREVKLADGAVSTTKLADGAVTGDKLAPGAIPDPLVADGSVTTDKLADGAVTAAKIGPNEIGSDQIDQDQVQRRNPGGSACAGGFFARSLNEAGTLTCRTVVAGDGLEASVDGNLHRVLSLGEFAVEALNLAPFSVYTAALQDQVVTTDKLGDLAVTSAKLGAASVTSGKLADGAVRADRLATLTRRSSAPVNVGIGQVESATANCDPNERAVSGGGNWNTIINPDLAILASFPSGFISGSDNPTSWTVLGAVNSGASAGADVTAQVLCLDA